jgi:hypothetical protein
VIDKEKKLAGRKDAAGDVPMTICWVSLLGLTHEAALSVAAAGRTSKKKK